ncbi:beta-2-microglobulin-like [Polypterus senegalus]|uniref:beta-2-microglobulin-like n=1 Tax=Polypterus senegalus TaxID=55291 RepID=UPI001966ABBE|nr:beta-2-microglobulin-like [Polypterus senegalus]
MAVKSLLIATLFLCHLLEGGASTAAPKVQIYSHYPGVYGQENVLICHVSGFHPPNIKIHLMKGKVPIPNTTTTDLQFNRDWRFQLTQSVRFTPQKGHSYSCMVEHSSLDHSKTVTWDPEV